jgi:hypothetical protein
MKKENNWDYPQRAGDARRPVRTEPRSTGLGPERRNQSSELSPAKGCAQSLEMLRCVT